MYNKIPNSLEKFPIQLHPSHDCSICLSSFFDLSRRRSRRDKSKNSECGKREKAPYKNKDSDHPCEIFKLYFTTFVNHFRNVYFRKSL